MRVGSENAMCGTPGYVFNGRVTGFTGQSLPDLGFLSGAKPFRFGDDFGQTIREPVETGAREAVW